MNGKFVSLCTANSTLLYWKCSRELFFHAVAYGAAVKSVFVSLIFWNPGWGDCF